MIVNTACRPSFLSHETYQSGGCRNAISLAANIGGSLGVHEESDDETVETQDFGENENENHADEESGLLGGSSHTRVTNDTNSETSGQTSKTHRQTRTQLNEARVERKQLGQSVGDQDGNDETVDTNDTSHNNGDDV